MMFRNSQPAITSSNTAGYHCRRKQMEVKFKYLSVCLESKDVCKVSVPTADNMADLLTISPTNATLKTFPS